LLIDIIFVIFCFFVVYDLDNVSQNPLECHMSSGTLNFLISDHH
jgi:hypothetical protein